MWTRCALVSAVAALVLAAGADADPSLTYTHASAQVTKPKNDGNGGIFKRSKQNYAVAGKGTDTNRFVHPNGAPADKFEIWAVAGLNGFGKLFSGSSAQGQLTIAGTYKIEGAAGAGANGTLMGASVYHNYIAGVGVAKLTGSGKTTITSNISIGGFPAVTPGPSPSTTDYSVGFIAGSEGNVDNQNENYTKAATGLMNGNQAVNIEFKVAASRTGGAVTSMASWIKHDFNWKLTNPAPRDGSGEPSASRGAPPEDTFALDDLAPTPPTPYPVAVLGIVAFHQDALYAENLAFDSSMTLRYTALEESSVADPEAYAFDGPTFAAGNAGALEYISSLTQKPAGAAYALQGMSFHDGQFDSTGSGLMTIDFGTGSTSPIALSRTLDMPSALVFGEGGALGTDALVVEMGSSSPGSTARLASVDAGGTVTTLVPDLGIENPNDAGIAPGGFGAFGSDLFILDVGQFASDVMTSDTGGLIVVDSDTLAISVFGAALNNPLSMAFGPGDLIGDPSQPYLYVLEMGDLDGTTGLPLGNGTVSAIAPDGSKTLLVDGVHNASSLTVAPDGLSLYFSDGERIYNYVPAPGVGSLLGLSAVAVGVRRRRR